MSKFEEIHQDRLKVDSAKYKGEISRRELLKRASPLGKVILEEGKCTGCGLCTLDCPTGALTASFGGEVDGYQLLFKHALCIACGMCAEVCPEQCLHVERALEIDNLSRPPAVLHEDKVVRCRQCGSSIGPMTMIDKIRARVLAAGQSFSDQLELCPMCKVKAQFSPMRK